MQNTGKICKLLTISTSKSSSQAIEHCIHKIALLICRFISGIEQCHRKITVCNCISRITCEFSVFNFRFSISAAAHSTQTLPICVHMNEQLLHKNQWQWFIIYMKKKKPHTQMRKTPRRSRFQGTTKPFWFRLCTFCGKKRWWWWWFSVTRNLIHIDVAPLNEPDPNRDRMLNNFWNVCASPISAALLSQNLKNFCLKFRYGYGCINLFSYLVADGSKTFQLNVLRNNRSRSLLLARSLLCAAVCIHCVNVFVLYEWLLLSLSLRSLSCYMDIFAAGTSAVAHSRMLFWYRYIYIYIYRFQMFGAVYVCSSCEDSLPLFQAE